MKLSELKDKKVLEAYDVFDGHLAGDQANYIRSCVDAGAKAVMDEAEKLVHAIKSANKKSIRMRIALQNWTKFKDGNDE